MKRKAQKKARVSPKSEPWVAVELGEIVRFRSGGTPDMSNPAYWGGDIPWLSAKDLKSFWLGNSQIRLSQQGARSGTRSVQPGTILILVRGMTLLKDVPIGVATKELTFNQDIKALEPSDGVDGPFIALSLLNEKQRLMGFVSHSGHGTGRLSTDVLISFPLLLPPLREQRRIASILSTWDLAIEQTERFIAAKRRRKQALMQQLLTGRRRFKEFVKSGTMQDTKFGSVPRDWQYLKIGEFAVEVSERNADSAALPVLSCTKYDGLVESLKYFGKRVFSEDTTNYKVVRRSQFAYPCNHIEEGSIGVLDFVDAGIVSPIYAVFRVDARVYVPFLYALFKTELYRHIFKVSTSASVDRRGSLRWNQFAQIKVALPAFEEQQKIADSLACCDREINGFCQKRDALKLQKKGLMQQLLTGKIRMPIAKGEDKK